MTKSSDHRLVSRSRIVTALALIPVAALIFRGGIIAALFCLLIGAFMSYESVKISGHRITNPLGAILFLMIVLPAVLVVMPLEFHRPIPPSYLLGMVMVGVAVIAKDSSAKILMAFLCACLFALMSILLASGGIDWLILAVASVIAADIGAYFGGRMIGGPKLIPTISPSKTWSGALCGVLAGGGAGCIAGVIIDLPPIMSAIAGLVIADLSIGGDLLESWFKRRHNVKDSGRILPGHGGVLDRFDGYLIVLPILYLSMISGLVDYVR